MAKQTFTTGQVLTAAQMTSLQQTAMGGGSTTAKTVSYVLVAADAGTVVQMNSASATTITVNTALFAAGDTVQIQNVGSGVCTVTAGTATVSTSATLALKQYDAGSLYFNTTSAAIFFAVDAADGMNNPMTTTGDIIYSSSGSTPARLGIGTTGQVLNVASGLPAWATPSSGGMTQLATGSLAGVSSVTTSTISLSGYVNLYAELIKPLVASDGATHRLRFNADTGTNYDWGLSGTTTQAFTETSINMVAQSDNGTDVNSINFLMHNPSSAGYKICDMSSIVANETTTANFRIAWYAGVYKAAAAITSVTFFLSAGNWTSGTYNVYGVK